MSGGRAQQDRTQRLSVLLLADGPAGGTGAVVSTEQVGLIRNGGQSHWTPQPTAPGVSMSLFIPITQEETQAQRNFAPSQ